MHKKHIHKKLDWKATLKPFLLSFRMLLGIHYKDNPFFLLFGRDPQLHITNYFPQSLVRGMKKCLFDLKTIRYVQNTF